MAEIRPVGASNEFESARRRSFLSRFECIDIDETVSNVAVGKKREHGLRRLPDAIIRASARSIGGLFVTRNTKDFLGDDPGIRVPYAIRGERG